MRRLLLLVVLAGLFATPPVFAQNTTRRVESVQATGKAEKAPAARSHDPAALQAVQAKPTQDPRPLQRLDNRPRPRNRAIEAFLARPSVGDPRAAATPVGTARWTRRPISTQGLQHTVGSGKTTTSLSIERSLRVERAANKTVRWLRGRLGRAEVVPGAGKQAAYTQAALDVAETYAGVLGLAHPADELRPMKTTEDDLGYVHARFEQVYQGLRVWGRDLYVHFDDTGLAYAVNGTYEPTPTGIDTRPALDEAAALRVTIDDLKARGRWSPLPDDVAAWLDVEAPRAELILYPDADRGMRLAYDVTLHPNFLEWYTYLIDAQTGEILNRIERHCTLHDHAEAPPLVRVAGLTRPTPPVGPRAALAGFFDATATDLNGTEQNLRVYQHDDNLFYSIWDLDNLNPASQLPNEPDGGAMTIDANSTDLGENVNLTHVTSANNTWNDPASVSAHVNMNIVYDYYKNTHGRNAIDGNDQSMISIIHVTDEGRPMDNAFWNGRVMAYGDGDQAFLPLAGALDVAAHEVTHGVIENTAGLVYQFQPGALNESFADVFGVLVEPNDFLLGEDIMRVNRAALRDLLNPDNPNVLSDQPAHMNQFQNLNADQDNGGVHINSGIPNRAAALIIQIIGIEKTERIYYRALTTYLTRNSQFSDARNALEQAAIDLFTENSSEVLAVQQSFDDVGIVSAPDEGGGDEGNDLPPQTGGASLVAFLGADGRIGLIDVTDLTSITGGFLEHPAAVALFDEETLLGSQLSTPLDGETIWFINQEGKLAFIEVATGEVNVFPNLFIEQEGDLRNVSIFPGGRFVMLFSNLADDQTMYFVDLAEGERIDIPLTPETTQEDIQDETIVFPDVLSWSPNPQLPRVAFDAFSEVDFVGESTISYWSIYEIDFDASTILNLIPAQPSDVNVGNITYSSTDPDLIAFNVITDEFDTFIGNFETGEIEALGIPGFTFNDVPITDGQRPSFSPDDTQLVFSSPEFGGLFFYDRGAGSLGFLNLATLIGSAPYNPRWFLRGGSGGEGNQAPTAGFTASATSGEAPLTITFDAGLSNDPDGDPLSYRWDFGDGSTGSGASVTHTFVKAGSISVTLTVTDGGGLSDTATQQINLRGRISVLAFDPQQEQNVLLVSNENGFVFGTNDAQDQAKAALFTIAEDLLPAQVTEVNVWFAFKRDGASLPYAIEILDGDAANGPGTLLGSEPFSFAGINADEDLMTAEPPTNHVLSSPVPVGSSFFVSVDFGSYGQADWNSLALVSSPRLGRRVAEVWEKWSDGSWNNLSDSWNWPNGPGTDGAFLWIEVVLETGVINIPVEDAEELPRTIAFGQNYPNPFRTETALQVELPARADVELHIIDLLGRTVATLVEGPMDAGTHTLRFDARRVPGLSSGVYLARLRAGGTMLTRKMVLVR